MKRPDDISEEDWDLVMPFVDMRRQRDEARRDMRALLQEFHDHGHPGQPCVRTGWIQDAKIDALRDKYFGRIGAKDE